MIFSFFTHLLVILLGLGFLWFKYKKNANITQKLQKKFPWTWNLNKLIYNSTYFVVSLKLFAFNNKSNIRVYTVTVDKHLVLI